MALEGEMDQEKEVSKITFSMPLVQDFFPTTYYYRISPNTFDVIEIINETPSANILILTNEDLPLQYYHITVHELELLNNL